MLKTNAKSDGREGRIKEDSNEQGGECNRTVVLMEFELWKWTLKGNYHVSHYSILAVI